MSKAKHTRTEKRFVIRKSLLGKGEIIKVEFKNGKTGVYDHDATHKKNKARFDKMPCFEKYGSYTSSSNFPTFAVMIDSK